MTGPILISIDENEYVNLRKICDEIFGEENFRNAIIVRRRVKSLNVQFADNGLQSFNVGFEYVLVYAKSDDFLMNPLRSKKKNPSKTGTWNVFWNGADRPTMRYELLGFTPETGQWRWSKEKAEVGIKNYQEYLENHAELKSLEEYWKDTGEKLKFVRRIPDGTGKNGGVQYWIGPSDTSLRTSNWTDLEVSQIRKDFDLPFENPKNVDLIAALLEIQRDNGAIVLDFFAGSGTTAHAVMLQNATDGGNRRFICVQLPETIDEKSDAGKAGYTNLSEIAKKRILLSGKKINSDFPSFKGDIGFKVFKLDNSNIRAWNPDASNLEQTLLDHAEHLVEGRSEQDVLYELLIKRGVDLTVPIEEKKIAEKTIYSIGFGVLFACLDEKIGKDETEPLAQGITVWHKELEPSSDTQVVFRDSAFADDIAKTNMTSILEQNGIAHVRSF